MSLGIARPASNRIVVVGHRTWWSACAFVALFAAPSAAQQVDWSAVDAALGRPGQMQEGGAQRYALARSDLTVTSRGVTIRPALSLGAWVGFKASGTNRAVAMGDLILTEQEIGPVMARLRQGGIGQTAIHKHLPEHTPALWWVHIHGQGDPVELARTVHEALALTGTPPAAPAAQGPASPIALDTAAVAGALGQAGRVNGGVFQFTIARAEPIRSMGIEVPPSLGVATVINFQPTTPGNAAVNGDFSMIASEVDAVLTAMRQANIEVVSLHNHLADEQPRLLFVHFWAEGNAVTLARGLRTALDKTNVRRGG